MQSTSRRQWLKNGLLLAAGAARWTGGHAESAAVTLHRPVAPFDSVSWDAVGLLVIEQREAESLSVTAEPELQPKILTQVRQGCLYITLAPGRLQTRQPLRIVVGVRSLQALRTNGSGSVSIGALNTTALDLELAASGELQVERLQARRLTLHMAGAGDVILQGGSVDAQRIVIGGSGRYQARKLSSRRAEVRIDGSGSAEVAVSDELDAGISGSGEIGYAGHPVLRQRITGAGSIERLGS